MFKKFLKILVFFSLGAFALYLVFSNQNKAYQADCALKGISVENCSLIDKVLTDFSGANIWFLVLAVFCFMVSNIARALRWNMLLLPLGLDAKLVNTSGAIMMAYMANLVFPRAGEVVRAGVVTKYENISFEKSFGTIMMDRILDVICLLIVALLSFGFAYNDIHDYFDQHFDLSARLSGIFQNWKILFIVFIVISVLSYLVWYNQKKFLSTKLFQKIMLFIKGIIEGSASILKLKNIPLFLVYTVVIWSMYFFMTYFGFKAFAPTSGLGPVAALVVFFMGSLGIVFPSPGGMGSYHFLVIASLAIYGIHGVDGFSYANISFFSIQICGTILFGLLATIFLPIYNRSHGQPSKSHST